MPRVSHQFIPVLAGASSGSSIDHFRLGADQLSVSVPTPGDEPMTTV